MTVCSTGASITSPGSPFRQIALATQVTGASGCEIAAADLTLDLVRHEARRDGRVIELTAKEFALLEYLMRHPGRVLTRTQIVDAVWRYDLEALSNVVDIYIHYLRDKIDQGFAHPLIKTVRGVGYKIEASNHPA